MLCAFHEYGVLRPALRGVGPHCPYNRADERFPLARRCERLELADARLGGLCVGPLDTVNTEILDRE